MFSKETIPTSFRIFLSSIWCLVVPLYCSTRSLVPCRHTVFGPDPVGIGMFARYLVVVSELEPCLHGYVDCLGSGDLALIFRVRAELNSHI